MVSGTIGVLDEEDVDLIVDELNEAYELLLEVMKSDIIHKDTKERIERFLTVFDGE